MKKNLIAAVSLITIIMPAVTSFAGHIPDVNMVGQYWFGSLKSNATTHVPWGERGTLTVTDDTWTQEWDDQSGSHTFSSAYTTDIQSDGSINVTLSSGTYNVAFNGDVMIHADSAPDSDNRLGIDIFARKAVNPQISDVTGNYRFFRHCLNLTYMIDVFSWGDIVVQANGTGTFKSADSDRHTESGNFTWTIDSVNSTLNVVGETYPQLLCKGGLMIRNPITEPPDDIELAYEFMAKKTTQTIVPADIAGTYQVRFLETGPGNVPYTCYQGTVIFNADGTFAADTQYSDGEHDTPSGTFKIGPGNKITLGGTTGIISPDKNLIFAPETDRPSNPASYDWIGGLFFIKDINSTPVFQFGSIGSKTQKLVISDPDGSLVTFSLTGGGYGEIEGGANFDRITLYDTTDNSQLTISTKSKTGSGVGDIICNGPMKGITAKNIDIEGEMAIGSTSNPKAAVAITFDQSDDLAIKSDMPIKSISAFDWTGSLAAPSVGSITIKSVPKQQKYGTLDIDLVSAGAVGAVKVGDQLTGSWECKSVKSITAANIDYHFYLTLSQEPNAKVPALGSLTVKNKVRNSRIISSGNIGAVTVGDFIKSVCFAGVDPSYLVDTAAADGVYDLPPASVTAFNQKAAIKSFITKGIAGDTFPCFENSNIAADNILTVNLYKSKYDNSGVVFGVTAGYIKSMTIKDLYNQPLAYKDLDEQVDILQNPPGNLNIRLY